MRRRDLVGFFAVSLTGLLTGRDELSEFFGIAPENPSLDAFRQLIDRNAAAALCRDLPADARIGRDPSESAMHLAASVQCPYDDAARLRRKVEERIRKDYADSNILIVRGWIVAVTEGRLAGLWRHA